MHQLAPFLMMRGLFGRSANQFNYPLAFLSGGLAKKFVLPDAAWKIITANAPPATVMFFKFAITHTAQ
jgi:hypothetical protein